MKKTGNNIVFIWCKFNEVLDKRYITGVKLKHVPQQEELGTVQVWRQQTKEEGDGQ